MDIDLTTWIGIFNRNPILIVILGGLMIGLGATQLVKKTALAFGADKVSEARYNASVQWCSVLTTFAGTHILWAAIIHEDAHGMNRAVSILVSVPSFYFYRWLKLLIAWKFPDLAAKLGNGNGKTT